MLKSSLNEDTNISATELAKKLDFQDRRRRLVYDREHFQKLLDYVENILQHI